MRINSSSSKYLLWVPPMLVAFAMALPLIYLLVRSASASSEAWDILFRWRTLEILGNSLLLVGTVTFCSLVVALPAAWLTTSTNLPLRKLLGLMLALPLVIPSYVAGFLVILVLGPKGFLQSVLESAFGVDRLPDLYGLFGATFVLSMLSFPYILLTVKASLATLDPALEEAATTLKSGFWRTKFRIILPQLRPAIMSGSLLVGLYTLSDFGAVSLLRYKTFTWAIYQQYENSFDRSIAALLSLVLVGVALLILLIEAYSRGKPRYSKIGSGTARVPSIVILGSWKWIAFGFCTILVLISLIMPMSVLLYWVVRGMLSGEELGVLWVPTLNSLTVSVITGLISVAIALPLVRLILKNRGLFAQVIERLSFTGFALPGIVVALALVFFGANLAKFMYQTFWILIFGYLVLFFPIALGTIRSAALQISPAIEESSRNLGKTAIETLWLVTLPLLRKSVLAGAVLVFLVTMKELPATLILGPLGFKSLATVVWSASSEAFFAQAAMPALLLIIMSSVPMGFLMSRDVRVNW